MKTLASFADQAIFALTQFLILIISERYLNSKEYGVLSVIFASYNFIFLIYNTYICEPMLIFDNKNQEINLSAKLHVYFILFLAVFAVILGLIYIKQILEIGLGFFMISLSSITILLVRRILFIKEKYVEQLIFGVSYFLLTILFVTSNLVLINTKSLNFLFLYFLSGIFCTLLAIYFLKLFDLSTLFSLKFTEDQNIRLEKRKQYLKTWLIPNLTTWIPLNLPVFAASVRGYENASDLRKSFNLVYPFLHLNVSQMPVFLTSKNAGNSSKKNYAISISYIVILSVYSIFFNTIYNFIYKNQKSLTVLEILLYLGIPILDYINTLLQAQFKQKTDLTSKITLLSIFIWVFSIIISYFTSRSQFSIINLSIVYFYYIVNILFLIKEKK